MEDFIEFGMMKVRYFSSIRKRKTWEISALPEELCAKEVCKIAVEKKEDCMKLWAKLLENGERM